MASAILETKLFAPRARDAHVDRPRLKERLDRGAKTRLTLISAPAGFGKTTMLAEWVASRAAGSTATAWVSLDAADADATSFWTYVATSIQRAVPALDRALAMVRETPSPPAGAVLTALVNDLASAETDLVLVLDDYHAISAPEVHEGVAFLIDHLPPTTHVMITTRADPPLPLARLRARGELVEIRAADLRFTADEAAAYLNDVADLGLQATDVAALEERTEGWIAALQLAALSLHDREDASAFIADFAGDDRFVVDYLAEEVLQRQPDDVRHFLLQTCILDRLTAELCDAVTQADNGRQMLDRLDRDNLFVIPLDSRREWYRYHHLFADVLRARLVDEKPDLVPLLHRRASEWFEGHGERDEAIGHALAGEDFDRAARLIELAIPEVRQARQEMLLRRWFGALPEHVFANRPVLSVGYVGALMSNGELQDVDALLTGAERSLDADASNAIVEDQAEFARLPSAIALYRAAQAQLRGDLAATVAHARRAYDLAGETDDLGRGGAAGLLALAHWANGDLEEAHGSWIDSMQSLERAGHHVDAIAIVRALAEIRAAQGRLRDARRTYERALERAEPDGGSPLRGAADLHTGLAELSLETGDLDAAGDHLLRSVQLDDQGHGLPQNAARRRIVAALIREAEGDAQAGMGLLDEAERHFIGEYFPVWRPIQALKARFEIRQGRVDDATERLRESRVSAHDELDYLHEFERVTLARLLIARGETASAVERLERLLTAAEAGGRARTVVEVFVLLAIGRRTTGDQAAALAAVKRALAMAEPEGYVRTFLAEGPPIVALLEAAVAHGISPTYAGRLLAAGDRPRRQPLDDPLSERELEVLRLLATDLSGPDMARELVVGLSTVRSHTKSIYAKLGVNSRRAAVHRAGELGLLRSTSAR